MKMKKLYFVMIACMALYACNEPASQITPELQSDFDYRSTQEVNLQASFADNQGNILAQVPYELSTHYAFDSTSLLANVTSGTGSNMLKLNLPTAVDTLYVRVNYAGIPARWKVPVSNGNANWSQATVMKDPIPSVKEYSTGGREAGSSLPFKVNYLGKFDNQGRPLYLEPKGDVIDAGLLARLNASLPESKNLLTTNPGYITSEDKSIEIREDADVWITFISEGAGYLNVLGYYTYNKESPPKTTEDLDNITIIFPNLSFPGSGGNLKSGDKVYIGKFKPGQMIGWVLFSNGFSNGNVTPGYWQLYSNQDLNSFMANKDIRQQNVLLNDEGYNRAILGFEDIRRDNNGDNDFNDVLFSITANPYTAINTDPLADLQKTADADNDGVSDKLDAYPKDPARAYDQYCPAKGSLHTLAFEDLWPSRGDYDFNDLVMGYNVQQVLNASNSVVDVKMTYQIRAVGGANKIGFAVQLPVSSSNLKEYEMKPSYTGNAPLINGAEAGQSQLVFPFFDDAHQVIRPSGGSFTNTVIGDKYIQPVTLSLNVTFSTPVSQSSLGTAPYNSFIFVNDRSVEVHLPNQAPTDLANQKLLGTSADNSKPSKGIYYMTLDHKPWAMLVPGTFDYPAEKRSIESAYLFFETWATSSGASFKDWYDNGKGYRDNSVIYHH